MLKRALVTIICALENHWIQLTVPLQMIIWQSKVHMCILESSTYLKMRENSDGMKERKNDSSKDSISANRI